MQHRANREFLVSLSRAFAGALVFSLPLLMTMEMWWLGMYLDRGKLALFIIVLLPVLAGISHFSGFQATTGWHEDFIDAAVAFAVGLAASALFLGLLGVLSPGDSLDDLIGKIVLLSIPASIGAVLASKQLGQSAERNEEQKRRAGYFGELFIMAAGSIFLAFNVAPTEEMVLIAYMMTTWHALALALVSIIIMHALVYTVGFEGQEQWPEGASFWHVLLSFTIVGYAISLAVSMYVLWTFDRFDEIALLPALMTTVVLAFPASLGAAVSRLVI